MKSKSIMKIALAAAGLSIASGVAVAAAPAMCSVNFSTAGMGPTTGNAVIYQVVNANNKSEQYATLPQEKGNYATLGDIPCGQQYTINATSTSLKSITGALKYDNGQKVTLTSGSPAPGVVFPYNFNQP